MEFVPFLGTAFTFYLPLALLIIMGMNAFNGCTKLLNMMGIDVSGDPDPENPDHEDIVQEGKHLLESGRRHAKPDVERPANHPDRVSFEH